MVQVICISKTKNSTGKITDYLLQDNSGNQIRVESKQLKMAIFSNQISVLNLKLTKDGKLIEHSISDKTANTQIDAAFKSKKKQERAKKVRETQEKSIDIIADTVNKTVNSYTQAKIYTEREDYEHLTGICIFNKTNKNMVVGLRLDYKPDNIEALFSAPFMDGLATDALYARTEIKINSDVTEDELAKLKELLIKYINIGLDYFR